MLHPVITDDGSSTLFHPELNEHYHSTFGALTESRHVFIENGLLKVFPLETSLNVLEVGFGTGLNALLTLKVTEEAGRDVIYETLEPCPLDFAEASSLNYPEILDRGQSREWFEQMHRIPHGVKEHITSRFTLLKRRDTLETARLDTERFHLVYFDAFSPNVQPELWTPGIFQKIADSMATGGTMTTYCAKGAVARAMKSAGLIVEKIPGPPGKRHMLRAMKA